MKKFLLIAMAAMTSIMAMAETKTFTDQLTVTVNGISSSQETTVLVEYMDNGTFNFVLKNFVLEDESTQIGVGNIVVSNLPLTKGDNYDTFAFNDDLLITQGDLEGVELWVGPMIGPIPLNLTGKINDDKVFVAIDIDMQEVLGQIIHVEFGTEFLLTTKTFTDQLTVTVNDMSTQQETVVDVQYPVPMNNSDPQTINFVLNNFVLADEATTIGVGNIVVANLALTKGKGFDTFAFNDSLLITEGDLEDIETWAGPMIGPIPLDLKGKINEDKVFVTIDIDMQEVLGQIIHVEFGSDIKPVYTVTYVLDGEVLSTEQVEEGGTVTLPDAPEKEGYTFAGWTGAPDTVTDDVTITGSYTINTYTVTYVIDGETLSSETVEYGGTVTLPEAPEKEGYTFEGWTGVPDAVTGDVTITGSYSVNTYTVFFVVDGEVVYQEEVAYGAAVPNFDYTPESDERYTRTFEGWDGEKYDTMPAHDVTYTAIITVVDGIRAVGTDTADTVVYDLSGRRVQRVTKAGIYIVNGKRVVLK